MMTTMRTKHVVTSGCLENLRFAAWACHTFLGNQIQILQNVRIARVSFEKSFVARQAGTMFAKGTPRFIVLVDIQRCEKSMTIDPGTTEEDRSRRRQIRLRLGGQFLSNALAILLLYRFTFDRPVDPWLSLDKIVLLLAPKCVRGFF